MASASSNEYRITQSQWDGLDFNLTTDNGNVASLATLSYWTEYYRDPIAWVAYHINNNYMFVLTSIGVPCNVLSFLVLQRIKPVTSAIFVMMILAVMDSITLSVGCVHKVTEIANVSYTNIGCSFMWTAFAFLQYYSIWLVVLLTLERVVAVCLPLKAITICTLSNARRSVSFLFILGCLLSIVRTFLYEERDIYGVYWCYVKSKYLTFYTSIWLFVDAMFFVIIPLTLLFLGNIAIIVKLRTSREIYSSSAGTSNQERKRQNRSVTIMLLTVCITTFVCLLPNVAISIPGLVDWNNIEGADIRTTALKQLAIRMIMLFTYSNNALNFFLYILGGRRFRGILREMVASWLGRQKTVGERHV